MKLSRKSIAAGAAAIALAGVAGVAAAAIKNAHVLNVRLPDGSVAHIHYVGDTPPTVSLAPAPISMAPIAVPMFAPAFDGFGPQSPFAALERISEAMDRQAETMLRQASVQPGPAFAGPGLTQVDIGALPPGASGYSMVSTLSGSGLCTRSVEYRSFGDGQPPKVLTRTSGACGAQPARPAPAATAPAATSPVTPVSTHPRATSAHPAGQSI